MNRLAAVLASVLVVATVQGRGQSATARSVGDHPAWRTGTATASVSSTMVPSGAVLARIPMRRSIGTIDAGDDAVWVTNPNEGTVTRMDPVTNRVAATIRIAKAYPVDVVTGNGAVWVVSDQQVLWMFKINPRTNTVTARIPLPGSPDSVRPLAVGAGSVWVVSQPQQTVVRFDLETNRRTALIDLPGAATALGVTDQTAWVALHHEDQMARIDSRTNKVVAIVDGLPNAAVVKVAYGIVWVQGYGNDKAITLSRIDPRTNRLLGTVDVGASVCRYDDHVCPVTLAAGAGAMWALTGESQRLVRIDSHTGRVVASLPLRYKRPINGEDLTACCFVQPSVAFGAGSLWVEGAAHVIYRVDPQQIRGS